MKHAPKNADTLANVERPKGDKPDTVTDEGSIAGYWHGSATSDVLHWKRRALAAEAENRRLRAEIAEAARRL